MLIRKNTLVLALGAVCLIIVALAFGVVYAAAPKIDGPNFVDGSGNEDAPLEIPADPLTFTSNSSTSPRSIPTASPERWEYRIESKARSQLNKKNPYWLAKLGREGWEMVSIREVSKRQIDITFKRPKGVSSTWIA